ncbi:MAG: signal peptidase II [Elusimicrobia bacterium]|nr:signal peptidase II [Elusimicrobiota bacterium]
MRKKSVIIILSVLLIDQLSKYYIVKNFKLHESVAVICNIFHITYITNTGTAYGMFQGYGNILLIFAIIAIIIISILVFTQRTYSLTHSLAFSLILGGAVGNLTDRLFRGAIVDFIDINLHFWPANPWPIFNIADSSVTIGVTILLIHSIFHRK